MAHPLEDFPLPVSPTAAADRTAFDFGSVGDIKPDDPRLAKLAAKWIALGYEGKGINPNRSHSVFAFTCACIRAGVDDDVVASCLVHWKIGEHVRDQPDVNRSLNRTIERAHQFVKDSKLFEMNEKYCVLPIGGSTRVVTWGDDPDFAGRKTIAWASSIKDFTSLHDKYRHSYQAAPNKKGIVETVTVGVRTWWINQPDRRQYDGGRRFMPDRDEDVVGNTLNLWQGFRVAARKPEGKSGAAGCKLFLDHGLKIICSGNEKHFDYLIKREALIAQKRIRTEVAVGLKTERRGTGKGFWERMLNHLYGPHAMQLLNPQHILGKHNPHLEVLVRLIADEALFAGDPRHRNALYGMITEPTMTIEPKFVNAYAAKNYLNLSIISNAPHFVPMGRTARRLFVLPSLLRRPTTTNTSTR